MPYRSPVADILFSLDAVAGLRAMAESDFEGDFDWETVSSVIAEAGRFATDEIAPLNRPGDIEGARYQNGVVLMPAGFGDVYRRWAEAGWAGVSAPVEFGGMGLPHLVNVGCTEIWNGASMAFALCPLLTEGAVGALKAFGSRQLLETYLGPMVAGRWTGTMNLTEPQAGSDLNAVRSRAEPAGDGTYRLFGQKIFITYGEHDMAENIVHLVLARLPDAPAGTRGLSLFLAPKRLVNPDGSLGARNDLRCASIEHKLGIHASPTCVMIYGENGGAQAWLVGEENRGLAAMFVMMNAARLAVGTQGIAIGERAYQQALDFARERRQGRGPKGGDGMARIIEHPDVQRMLMTMKANVHAGRGICHLTAASLDLAAHGRTAEARAAAANRAALLTPVAKAFSSEVGDEAASLGVQIHGGMGFVEETGAAQHMRNSRITAIYEGANGVQAIDLVQRKLLLAGGETVKAEIADIRDVARAVAEGGAEGFGGTAARLSEGADALSEATRDMLQWLANDHESALAGASQYLRLFGLTLGGACLAKAGLAAQALAARGNGSELGRVGLARFFAEKLLPVAPGHRARHRLRVRAPSLARVRAGGQRMTKENGFAVSSATGASRLWPFSRHNARRPRPRCARSPRDSGR